MKFNYFPALGYVRVTYRSKTTNIRRTLINWYKFQFVKRLTVNSQGCKKNHP